MAYTDWQDKTEGFKKQGKGRDEITKVNDKFKMLNSPMGKIMLGKADSDVTCSDLHSLVPAARCPAFARLSLLSERQNGLKTRAFGDWGLSGGSFFMNFRLRHCSNSEIESDNSNGENDNSREKCDNTH